MASTTTRGIGATRGGRRILWAASGPTPGDFMICTGTFGNGVLTGTTRATTRRARGMTRQGRRTGAIAFFAAVAGALAVGAAAVRAGAGAGRCSVSACAVCAWCRRRPPQDADVATVCCLAVSAFAPWPRFRYLVLHRGGGQREARSRGIQAHPSRSRRDGPAARSGRTTC